MREFFSVLLSGDVPFLWYAMIASLLSSLPLGMVGSFVVVKNMGSIAGAISHSVIGGIGLALYLQVVLKWGWVSPQMGALSFALLSAVLLGWLSKKGRERLDTAINAIWVIGMSLGIVFLAVTPTYTDPMSYLFGNILLLSREDLVVIAVLGAFVVFSVVLFYPQLQAVSFDEEFARTRGVATRFFFAFFASSCFADGVFDAADCGGDYGYCSPYLACSNSVGVSSSAFIADGYLNSSCDCFFVCWACDKFSCQLAYRCGNGTASGGRVCCCGAFEKEAMRARREGAFWQAFCLPG